MTAEERLAYFHGEKRRDNAEFTKKQEKNTTLIVLKLKFFLAVILFVVFLSLDYTGYKFYGIGSEEIMDVVTTDLKLPEELKLPQIL